MLSNYIRTTSLLVSGGKIAPAKTVLLEILAPNILSLCVSLYGKMALDLPVEASIYIISFCNTELN